MTATPEARPRRDRGATGARGTVRPSSAPCAVLGQDGVDDAEMM
ncbi:hypothetical protein [Streptomyces graminofaciens]|nr:hypothetical protein [Streptomyces graminofaciens]